MYFISLRHGTLSALRRMLPRDRGTIIRSVQLWRIARFHFNQLIARANMRSTALPIRYVANSIHDKSNVKVTAVQMPAMNTTQFDWVKNCMPNDTQPVPPIFEPEVSAEVVVAAGLARRPRREYWVGSPTVEAIVGQKFFPGLLDIYLGKTGYKSQQIKGEKRDPNTPNNLYKYVPGVHSARGKFADRSKRTSAEVFLSLHRGWFALGALATIGACAALIAGRRRG